MYEVHHSYPFTHEQKQELATAITNLHCEAFTTPSFFVHVRFSWHDASDKSYFMAGKPRTTNCNRIIGIVRTSPTRPISAFDTLAADIENSWDEILRKCPSAEPDSSKQDMDAKRLLMVTFTPMITIREGGMTIPEAGQEGSWLKKQLPYINEMSEKKGLGDFTELLKELEERQDLKRLLV